MKFSIILATTLQIVLMTLSFRNIHGEKALEGERPSYYLRSLNSNPNAVVLDSQLVILNKDS